jgi:MFS family permease
LPVLVADACPAYLVEIFPYIGRSRGIAWFQFYGRGAGFFATYVNPVGLANITWRWLLVYCCWLVFEIFFIYFFFPETSGRTLEELSFCKSSFPTFREDTDA